MHRQWSSQKHADYPSHRVGQQRQRFYFLRSSVMNSPSAKDGSTQVTTEAVHPIEAFRELNFKLDWTPTPRRKMKQQDDAGDRDR